jgi:hypothetical protein
VSRIRTPHRKQKKLQKTSENRQEMWAAMTRSLEMIVALFEYYSASVVTQPTDVEESTPTHEIRYQLHVLDAYMKSYYKTFMYNVCTCFCIF